ncbi:MAG: hypothetical protein ABF868_03695 [Sporolactobacillus sp.]
MNFQPYTISQSQMIETFVPEQLLRARVIDLLPDRTALLQIGTRQIVAQVAAVEPPMKIGQDYLFQIQKQTDPLVAKVVNRKETAGAAQASLLIDDVLHTLNLTDDAATRRIIRSFLDNDDAMTRENIESVRALIGGSTPSARDLEAVHWMLQRHLPLNKSMLNIARALADNSQSLTEQLGAFARDIEHAQPTASIAVLRQSLERLSESRSPSELSLLAVRAGRKQAQSAIESLPGFSQTAVLQAAADQLIDHHFSAAALSAFAELLSPAMAVGELSDRLRAALSRAAGVSAPAGSADFSLLAIMHALGLDHEAVLQRQLSHNIHLETTGTLKEALLAVAADRQLSSSLRGQATHVLQQLTGEQLQLLATDTPAAQFTLQFPVPTQQGMQNLTVYWEGKRNKKGSLDPGYCTLLLCLELNHLHQTMISVRVQDHTVSLRIKNDQFDLRQQLERGRAQLARQLERLGYRLSTVSQTDQLDSALIAHALAPLTPLTSHLDVKA